MKLPRLPHKCNIFDAKYSAEQMREYGERCIKEYMKQLPTLIQIAPPVQRSMIEKIKDVLS